MLTAPFSDYSSWQRRKSLVLGAAIGIVVALLCFLNRDHAWLRFAENLIQRTWMDRYYATYGHSDSGNYVDSSSALLDRTFTEKLVLVVFDDSSLRSGLQWPIPRELYRDIVRKLKKAGAKTVAFDIIFSGPGPSAEADKALSEAIDSPEVIMPYGLMGRETSIARGLLYPQLIENWNSSDREKRLGFTMEVSDPIDKRVRLAVLRVTPPPGISGPPHYSLTVMALAHYWDISPQEVLDRLADKFETTDITLTGSPYAFTATVGRIAYCGSDLASENAEESPANAENANILEGRLGHTVPQQPQAKLAKVDVPPISDFIQVWPVQDILNTPDEELSGLFGTSIDPHTGTETPNRVLAILGVNVPGGCDIKMSDVGSISGVSIHANIMWNLMQGTFLRDYNSQSPVLFILGMALLATLLATYFETKWSSALFILQCSGYWYGGYLLMYGDYFGSGGTIVPIFTPWLGALASFSAVTIRNVLVERSARQTMHNALADVLPVPDIEDWVNNRGLEIGSEERNLTILFSDIRGYTDLSETLNPVDITEMLNTYHEAMGSIFERYGGIIFDYQGDAQMVVFGLAPASQPNHAAAAVKAASGMVLRLEQLRSEWKAQKRPVFECGVGVCTGSVALGVIGSKYRKQICAIGDPTNTSARMQGKSKELGCPVLMTESTFQAAGEEIDAHYIQSVSVKGKREPLNVYGVDLEAMRTRLSGDGLAFEEIVVVLLVAALRRSEEADTAELREKLRQAALAQGGQLAENSGECSTVTAIFGWGPFNRHNHALEAYRAALELQRSYSPSDLFLCLHSGFATVREENGNLNIQGESWNIARDINEKCRGTSTALVATEALLPAWGSDIETTAISTYRVPHKKQTLALYTIKAQRQETAQRD